MKLTKTGQPNSSKHPRCYRFVPFQCFPSAQGAVLPAYFWSYAGKKIAV